MTHAKADAWGAQDPFRFAARAWLDHEKHKGRGLHAPPLVFFTMAVNPIVATSVFSWEALALFAPCFPAAIGDRIYLGR